MAQPTEVVFPEEVDHPPPPRRDRLASWIADKCSTTEFALANLLIVIVWPLLGVEKFPYPFLTLVLSIEAIQLTVFVLVQQRLQAEMQDREIDADMQNDAIAADRSQKMDRQLNRIERVVKKIAKGDEHE